VTRTLGDELSAGRQVGVGRPVAGIDISIIGPDGHTLPDGEIGEVAVRCPWRMLGYIGSTDEPVLATDRGAILLGDLGRIEDGYLFIEGRTRELIKSGGEQIFPVEVENQLLLHPDVIEAAAYGVPDETWGERLECMVVLRLGSEVTSAELRDFCRTSLAGFKVPKVFVFGDSVPKTVNQKVDRAALRRQATGAHA
jgi:acyl-CoA synthetase (AMP-forming)/AMP-acid ligase II